MIQSKPSSEAAEEKSFSVEPVKGIFCKDTNIVVVFFDLIITTCSCWKHTLNTWETVFMVVAKASLGEAAMCKAATRVKWERNHA